jgi:hypothetical protein
MVRCLPGTQERHNKKGEHNMLKALLLLLMNLALAAMATAQTNLVLNGSFEDTLDCAVPMASRLPKAEHWFNPTEGTPDLFDCDLERVCGLAMDLPYWNGFVLSQDGSRHAGAFFWDDPPDGYGREYLMTELAEELAPEERYEVSLWYSSHRPAEYAVDHIGIWFGSDSVYVDTLGPVNLVPQVLLRDPNNAYLAESEVWTELTDTLLAQGGERWMVIGNFDPVGQVFGSQVNPNGLYEFCYYHIDNVIVRRIGTTGFSERSAARVFWNGSHWSLMGYPNHGQMIVEVMNVLGALLYREHIYGDGTPVHLGYDPPSAGSYVLNIVWANGRTTVRFIK